MGDRLLETRLGAKAYRASRRIKFLRPVGETLRSPLYRNGYALIVNTVGTGALGLLYWLLAARYYPAEIVGQNAAIISAMLFVSGVSNLNVMSAMIRFIPKAGHKTTRLVVYGYLACLAAAGGLSLLAYLSGGHELIFGFSEPDLGVNLWFVLATLATCIFLIQDAVLTGLSQTVWVPVENIGYGIAKIALLIFFSTTFPLYGIFASWTLPMILLILGINLLMFLKLVPRHIRTTEANSEPLIPAQVIRYVGGNYLVHLLGLATMRLLPLVVFYRLGPSANAYFFLPWNIVLSLKLITSNMATSMVVEGSRDRAEFNARGYRFMLHVAKMYIPLVALLLIGAPALLQISGSQYALEGSRLLRLLVLSAIPDIITTFYASLARIHQQVSGIVLARALFTVLALGSSYFLIPAYGITGVGIAVLITETVVALAVLPAMLRLYRLRSATPVLAEPAYPERS